MDIQGFHLLWLVQFVDLGFFLDQILSHFFVSHLTHVQRLVNILTHLLLFQVILPLFNLKVLSVDLLQVLIHLLILPE